jgi:hypothetical protein
LGTLGTAPVLAEIGVIFGENRPRFPQGNVRNLAPSNATFNQSVQSTKQAGAS